MASFFPQGAIGRRVTYELLWLASARRYAAFNCGFTPVDADIAAHPDSATEARQVQLYRELLRFGTRDDKNWCEQRILEAGCGAGHGLAHIRSACRPAQLIGLDFSAAGIMRARRRGLEARRGNADALPFADAYYLAVLEHV